MANTNSFFNQFSFNATKDFAQPAKEDGRKASEKQVTYYLDLCNKKGREPMETNELRVVLASKISKDIEFLILFSTDYHDTNV